MKIGTLAERTGLTPDAIRFYEKAGLLDARHVRRTENRYREYSEDAVEQIRAIKETQAAGFTLSEFRELDRMCRAGRMPPGRAVDYLRRKIDTVNARIAELKQVKSYLARKLEELRS